MTQTTTEEFKGFELTIKTSDIIIGKAEELEIYDDGSGLTGDVSSTDHYFNDDMLEADRALDKLLMED